MTSRILQVGCIVVMAAVSTPSPAAARLPRAEPQAVGFSPERLALVDQFISAEIARGRIPGAVMAIARRYQAIAD